MALLQVSAFKAKVDDRWQPYAREANELLKEAYAKGFPSVRFAFEKQAYKFDFVRMQQKNLLTNQVAEMCPPLCLKKRTRPQIKQLGPRPVFVVRVPPDGPGSAIPVPHPKQLGKALRVQVPKEARPGQKMFVPMPRGERTAKAKSIAMGTAAGTCLAGTVLLSEEVIVNGGLGALGSLVAGAGGIGATMTAPVCLGGVAVAGAVAAGAAAVHMASRNPVKTIATGVLAVGGLALVDHTLEHGVLDTASDLVEGAGDAADAAADLVGDAGDGARGIGEAFGEVGEGAVDWAEGAADWLDSWEDCTANIIDSLF